MLQLHYRTLDFVVIVEATVARWAYLDCLVNLNEPKINHSCSSSNESIFL